MHYLTRHKTLYRLFFNGLISWFFEKKTPGKIWILSTVVAVCGLVLINSVDNASFQAADLVLPVFAGACYAVEIAVSKHLTVNHRPEEAMMIITGLVGIALLPFFAYFPIGWVFTVKGVVVALGLGVMTCALAFSLTVAGLKTTSAPVGSTLALAEPMGAAVLGIAVLHEPADEKTILGIALVLLSVIVLVVSEFRATRTKRCEKSLTDRH